MHLSLFAGHEMRLRVKYGCHECQLLYMTVFLLLERKILNVYVGLDRELPSTRPCSVNLFPSGSRKIGPSKPVCAVGVS
jgi:hypothetical protein